MKVKNHYESPEALVFSFKSEGVNRAEMKQLQEEKENLRDKVNLLTAHEFRNV